MLITVIATVSREIRGWIAIRKQKKDGKDESNPPFSIHITFLQTLLSGTTFYTSYDNILIRVSLPAAGALFRIAQHILFYQYLPRHALWSRNHKERMSNHF